MARKFLYLVAAIIVLIIIAFTVYRLFPGTIYRAAFVPPIEFEKPEEVKDNAYAKLNMWFAHPDIKGEKNPALWLPDKDEAEDSDNAGQENEAKNQQVDPQDTAESDNSSGDENSTGSESEDSPYEPAFSHYETPEAAIFYVHPTSYLSRAHWNAPLNDTDANKWAQIFLRGQASAFNGIGPIWAPRYRQAAFGAFLTDQKEALMAMSAAYHDVLTAFDEFISQAPKDLPIILAGHSQGARHLTYLLQDRIARQPLANRIAAVYIVGWPVSLDTDLEALFLPPCETADDSGCLLSWGSFAEPADPQLVVDYYNNTIGFNGKSRKDTSFLCTNPISGIRGDTVKAEDNLGTIIPNEKLTKASIIPALIGAKCDKSSFLLIGKNPPEMGPGVLPGNNYHVYDYPLFWANIRKDAAHRVAQFIANPPKRFDPDAAKKQAANAKGDNS